MEQLIWWIVVILAGIFIVCWMFSLIDGHHVSKGLVGSIDERLSKLEWEETQRTTVHPELDPLKMEKRISNLEEVIYGPGVKFEDVS